MILINKVIIYECKKKRASARRKYRIVLNLELDRYYSMIFDIIKYHRICIQYYCVALQPVAVLYAAGGSVTNSLKFAEI